MKVTPITNPLPGERVVAVWPRMAVQVDAKWHRRLNLYDGRTLSEKALAAEQNGRVGRLVTLAQMLSPGVVSGLEIDLEVDRQILHVAPGVGLTAWGEDVVVPHALQINVLDLVPVTPSPDPSVASLGVLVLEPVTVRRWGESDEADPGDFDESDDAFADEHDLDGCRLVYLPWLAAWDGVKGPVSPLPLATWRNRVAYHVFGLEELLPFGEIHPWETHGVPIGVVGFAATGATWVDRHSVVRAGGKAKLRAPLIPGSGNPFLWQARLQQFAEQLSEQGTVASPQRIGAYEYLPPAGILPRDSVDIRARTNSFFPTSWTIRAIPLPVEQLDEVIDRCDSLAPIATHHGERIVLLVPVPQSVYEPRLLVDDMVDPVFRQTVTRFTEERESKRSLRMAVRRDYRALVRAVDGLADVPQYSDPGLGPADMPPDPDATTNEPASVLPPNPALAGGRFGVNGTGPDIDRLDVASIRALRDRLYAKGHNALGSPRPLFTQDELWSFDAATGLAVSLRDRLVNNDSTKKQALTEAQLRNYDVTAGLSGFVEMMKQKLQRADDLIDFSFLKSHTNVYRIRQHLLGNTAATRLATSPALAEIAKGKSAKAVTDEVNSYFYAVKCAPPATLPRTTMSSLSTDDTVREAAQPTAARKAAGRTATIAKKASTSYQQSSSVDLYEPDLTTRRDTLRELDDAEPTLTGAGFLVARPQRATREPLVVPEAPTRATVQNATPIAGGGAYDFRTVSIAQRIQDPAAMEAKSYAVTARAEAVQALQVLADLHMRVDDITVFGVPERDANKRPLYNKSGLPIRTVMNFETVRKDLKTLLLTDPAPLDPDEGSFFSEAVTIIEHMIATLRAIEGRIAAYRSEIALCERVLIEVEKAKSLAAAKLAEFDIDVAEARHKVASATALLADETTRINTINNRRHAVLREHLSFLAYVRPRYVDARVDTPIVTLNPGLLEASVPACLAGEVSVAHEIEQMVQLLREAPISWLVDAPQLLEKLDRVELLHGTLQVAKSRAVALHEKGQVPSTFVSNSPVGRFGPSIARVTLAQQQVVVEYRMQAASVDLARFASYGWRQTQEAAVHLLSLGDLIESNHGRSTVTDAAARELAQITRVAGGLHSHACDVLPMLRLEWANRLGELDTSVNLRDLAILPRWSEVEFTLRKEMQILTDWLYGRINMERADAVAWMHDLVRICLLLASHVPVDEIIAGQISVASRVTPGRTVAVEIDPAKVRLGMKVLFYKQPEVVASAGTNQSQPQVVAHGVVEDLVGGQARTRIAEAFADDLTLDKGTRAQFVHPESRSLPTFARKLV